MAKKKAIKQWNAIADMEPRINDLLFRACWLHSDCQRQVAEQRAWTDLRSKMIWDEEYEPDESWWGPLTEEEWEDALVSTQKRAWSSLKESAQKFGGRDGAQTDDPVLGDLKAYDIVYRRLHDAMVGIEWDDE